MTVLTGPFALSSLRTPTAVGLLSASSGVSLARGLADSVPQREAIAWASVDSPKPPLQFAANAANPAGTTSVDAKTLALLAADVYKTSATPPAGYRVATPGDLGALGLKPQDLTSTQSGFTARVYVKGSGADAEFVVAFRGSTSDKSDWISNLRQGIGLNSDHYSRALRIGQQLARSGNARVTLTGHSLGGGLASAAAIASGRNATTFNAAGLSDATIRTASQARTAAGVARAGAVSAFYIRGEVLSAIQDGGDRVVGAIFGGIRGGIAADAPSAYGTRIALDPVRPQGTAWYQDTPVARHAMDWVIASLNRG
jgi:Lipase (class 3)